MTGSAIGAIVPGDAVTQARAQVKVVFVSSAHPWTDNRVHIREAASLAAAGYNVTLVAVENELMVPATGVAVQTIPRRSRAARLVVSGIQVTALALRTKASVVHLHDPELIWVIPLFRILRRKVIYDAHEDLPAQIMDKKYLPSAMVPLARLVSRILVRASRLSDRVVSATETIAKRYPPNRTTVIHNYPPLRVEESSRSPVATRKLSAVYIGAMSRGRGAEEMVRAANSADFPSSWALTIAGTATVELTTALRVLPGWNRVDYLGTVTPNAARDLLLESRVGVVVLQATPAYIDSLPTKMFEYMAAGIPIIASDFPLWRDILERYDCGILVDETMPDEIARAIRRYADDPELLTRHGENARRAAEKFFNWEGEGLKLISLYDELTGIPRPSHQSR